LKKTYKKSLIKKIDFFKRKDQVLLGLAGQDNQLDPFH
jgi:hypothetical protein